MFDEMRKNTKTVMWITVVSFIMLIFLAWGADFQMGGQQQMVNEIGRVDGVPIAAQNYELAWNSEVTRFRQQTGREPDERTATTLRAQAWTALVQQSLLEREATRRGITVTDAEIIDAVLNNPPPEIVSNPGFQTNGQFDLAKYQAALRNPNVDTRPLEEQWRRQLPLLKLQNDVLGSVTLSDEELWDSYRFTNDRARVEYLLVPADRFNVDETAIGEADLRQYYDSHQGAFRAAPAAQMQYVLFPRRHTEGDSLDLYEQARSIVEEARGGEEFLGLVESYSEAGMTQRGGETAAWINPDQLAGAVRDAARNLPIGQVSDVLLETGGFHVLRVEDRREDPTVGTQVKVADIYLPIRPSPETLTEILERAGAFRGEIGGKSLESAAQELGLPVRETRSFSERGFIQGLGSAPEIQQFAFSNKVGTVTPPIERPDGWLVGRLSVRTEARVQDFAEAQDRTKILVVDSLRLEQATQMAQGLLAQAQAGAPLASLARTDGSVVLELPEPFTRPRGPVNLGADPTVMGPIFAATGPGLIPKVLEAKRGAVIARVLETLPTDRATFEEQKNGIRDSQLRARQSQILTAWLDGLQKDARIEDFRTGVFQN